MDDASAAPPSAGFANLNLQDDNQNPEAAPSNAAMADAPPEEHIVEPAGTETDNVAIIHTDNMDTYPLLATDCRLAAGCWRACQLTPR